MTSLAPSRVLWRSRAGVALGRVLARLVAEGNAAATQRAVAERLDISHAHMQRLCGDGDPAVALGDVCAMGPTVARAVLRELLTMLEDGTPTRPAEDPQLVALRVLGRTGRLADEARAACEDGTVTPDEWRRVDARLAEIEAEVAQGRAAVRAALGRAG